VVERSEAHAYGTIVRRAEMRHEAMKAKVEAQAERVVERAEMHTEKESEGTRARYGKNKREHTNTESREGSKDKWGRR